MTLKLILFNDTEVMCMSDIVEIGFLFLWLLVTSYEYNKSLISTLVLLKNIQCLVVYTLI